MSEGSSISQAWEARYGQDSLPPAVQALNPVLEQLLSHRSVRAYAAHPLPEGTLETLIAAAQSASSSSNLQVWSVIAVEDAARKARLATLAGRQEHVRTAPLFLVWLADLSRIERAAALHGEVAQGLSFLEALVLGIIDAAIAAQNAVVALESMGLSSVYIGGIRNHAEAVAAELGLPARVFPVFGMCVGYPDPLRPALVKPRLPQQAVLHREQYSAASQDAAIARYDDTLQGFFAGQGQPHPRWSLQAVRRLLTPESLHGRERLTEALNRLGFELR